MEWLYFIFKNHVVQVIFYIYDIFLFYAVANNNDNNNNANNNNRRTGNINDMSDKKKTNRIIKNNHSYFWKYW